MRTDKQLLLDSRAYAQEHRLTSWWCVWSTLGLFLALQATILVSTLWVGLIASVFAGLVIIRMFVIYHDYEHGTILRKSRLAWCLFRAWSILTLSPASIWRHTHEDHHKHNSKLGGTATGAFPIMTVEQYADATPRQRRAYHTVRHPLVFVFGYFTVFLYGICLRSFMKSPGKHIDSGVALFMHLAVLALFAWYGIPELLLCIVLPAVIAAMLGSYLFYAQHVFPDAYIHSPEAWSYTGAALRSSSYMEMNPLMAWFTGNVGYHHVHHLNHHIPFYRLPEAMADLEELQSPGTTSLDPRDILACLRLKLWDVALARLVPYPG